MNKRRLFSGHVFLPRSHYPAFMICAALFCLGVVAGTFLSTGFCSDGGAEEYMSRYLPSLLAVEDPGSAGIFWMIAKYHIAAFLLGFSVLGVVLIPALSFFRGFSLAFTLSVLTRLYSLNGALMGCILFAGVSALSVPLLFVVAAGSFFTSLELGRVWFSLPFDPFHDARSSILRFLAVILILFLLALGERAVLNSGLLDFPIFS